MITADEARALMSGHDQEVLEVMEQLDKLVRKAATPPDSRKWLEKAVEVSSHRVARTVRDKLEAIGFTTADGMRRDIEFYVRWP
jgi:hypothetical protein